MARKKRIPFIKMSGSGNDFIIIDNRRGVITGMSPSRLAARICTPRLSVGGDGLILIERSRNANVRWRLFNADGSKAAFSGNGARCAARCASLKKIAPPQMTCETPAGLIRAEVRGDVVTVGFPPPTRLQINLAVPLDDRTVHGHFIEAGVPHFVTFVDALEEVDIVALGRQVRRHPVFHPEGANVNFVRITGPRTLTLRTYERGVEDETLACGSGSVASSLIAGVLGKVSSPVTVTQRSGEKLRVSFSSKESAFSDVSLTGDARVVYEGVLWEEAWEY